MSIPHFNPTRAPIALYPNNSNLLIQLETYFTEKFGPIIHPNYVNTLQQFLKDIYNYTLDAKLSCSIVSCSLRHTVTYVEINNISVRPCAQKLGFFRLFMWNLIQICRDTGRHLKIKNPSDDLVRILFLISPKFEVFPHHKNILLRNEDLNGITSRQLGVENMFIQNENSLILKVTAFPTERYLNNEIALDERITYRQWVYPVIPYINYWDLPRRNDILLSYNKWRPDKVKAESDARSRVKHMGYY